MKCFERIVHLTLLKCITQYLDPSQFAYKQNRSTDDATLTLLHHAYTYLEKSGSFVCILFVDFSSAFNTNTIQPHLMAAKLLVMNVCDRLVLWIVNFLVQRTHSVRYETAVSSPRSISAGCLFCLQFCSPSI